MTLAVRFCDRCGEPVEQGRPVEQGAPGAEALGRAAHEDCAAARLLEPPRFCPACRRRMKVQVLPTGWTATCVEHGETRSV